MFVSEIMDQIKNKYHVVVTCFGGGGSRAVSSQAGSSESI
jgi:threonine dehydratase